MKNDYKIKLTPSAAADLDEILNYISRILAAPEAASSLLNDIVTEINLLIYSPARFPLCNDRVLRRNRYRFFWVKKYIVFYKIDEQNTVVIVMRVLHGTRNLIDLL